MLDWLLGKRRPSPPSQTQPASLAVEPINLRVAMIVYDPILEDHKGRRLHAYFGWNDPATLAQQYIADLYACSGGIARYTIVEQHIVDGYPPKIDGFTYDDATYLACWRRKQGFHQPDTADYRYLLDSFDLFNKVQRHEIDEVWLFAFPYAGFYESHMVGAGAIWCNSPPLGGSGVCERRFVVMGFNYERDVGCMLENFGHRVESTMAHVYRAHHGERNLWERFTRYDLTHPGRAECGTVHFAPNSRTDYDWGNPHPVMCHADAWYTFPDLSAPPRLMEASAWGGGDMRLHHLWWLEHLPRAAGVTDGVLNNWWAYVLRPELLE